MQADNAALHELERRGLFLLLNLILSLKRGKLNPASFTFRAQGLLESIYVKAAALGSGNERPDFADQAAANILAVSQVGYLGGLAAGVTENAVSGKELRARATLYILLANGIANRRWTEKVAEVQGPSVEALWVKEATENCRDCIDESNAGWRPLASLERRPGEGKTLCLSRCRCHLVLRDGSKGFSNR